MGYTKNWPHRKKRKNANKNEKRDVLHSGFAVGKMVHEKSFQKRQKEREVLTRKNTNHANRKGPQC